MDLATIEITTPGSPWTRGDRAGGKDGADLRDRLADSIGEQAADGRDQGHVKVGGVVYLWRFTAAAARDRAKAARAAITDRGRGKTGRDWLGGDEGRGLLRVAGWTVEEAVAEANRGRGKKVKAGA